MLRVRGRGVCRLRISSRRMITGLADAEPVILYLRMPMPGQA
ncbi:hypothetical protein [Paenibacillus camelliae]|nr:hypothetical protein [Paenibacillus camelliae]